MDDIASNLPAKERGKINKRTLSSSDDKNYPIGGEDVADQQLWPLSGDEYGAIGSNKNVRSYGSDNWLRSSGFDNFDLALCAPADGTSNVGGNKVYLLRATRPALNLNVTSVIFTSDARVASGKASASPGGGLVSVTLLTPQKM